MNGLLSGVLNMAKGKKLTQQQKDFKNSQRQKQLGKAMGIFNQGTVQQWGESGTWHYQGFSLDSTYGISHQHWEKDGIKWRKDVKTGKMEASLDGVHWQPEGSEIEQRTPTEEWADAWAKEHAA